MNNSISNEILIHRLFTGILFLPKQGCYGGGIFMDLNEPLSLRGGLSTGKNLSYPTRYGSILNNGDDGIA